MSDTFVTRGVRILWPAGTAISVPAAAFDAATLAWVAAVVGDGGTVSATEKGYVDTLIVGLRADGLFSKLDRLWLLASENTHQAKIDIIALQSFTLTGSPTFAANAGYTGVGDTGIDTNFIP